MNLAILQRDRVCVSEGRKRIYQINSNALRFRKQAVDPHLIGPIAITERQMLSDRHVDEVAIFCEPTDPCLCGNVGLSVHVLLQLARLPVGRLAFAMWPGRNDGALGVVHYERCVEETWFVPNGAGFAENCHI